MFNLPFVPAQTAAPEPAAVRKPSESKQESSGFSDVYDDLGRESERASDDVNAARDTRDNTAEESSNTDDSRSNSEDEPQTKSQTSDDTETDKDTTQESDYAATQSAQDSETQTPKPNGTLEGAAQTRAGALVAEAEAGAAGATPEGDSEQVLAAATTAVEKGKATPVPQASITGMDALAKQAAPKTTEAKDASAVEGSKLVLEAEEGLEAMRVEVRATAATQAQTAPTTQAPIGVAQQAAQSVSQILADAETGAPTDPLLAEPEPEADLAAIKPETPNVPTISTTQQMQARAIIEQVQAGAQVAFKQAQDSKSGLQADAFMAALEESQSLQRTMMSPQEMASQTRLANSAPNPAYVVRQLANAAKTADNGMIELTMDPPELGKVRMSMSETAGVMAVTITADNQATSELMRRHIDMLRKDFMELGYQDVAFSFEQNGSDSSQQQAGTEDGVGFGGGTPGDEAVVADAPNIAAQNIIRQTVPDSGLDIRL